MKATTKIILDKRAKSKNSKGLFPVCIRVTFDRQPRTYSTGKYLSEDDFVKVMGERPRGVFKDHNTYLHKMEIEAIKVIDNLGDDFTFEKFKNDFKGKSRNTDTDNVYNLFEIYINELRAQDRIKTAISYKSSCRALKKFREKLKWKDVTPSFLASFEKSFTDIGKSKTSVGIYLRSLKAIINIAIEKGYMDQSEYPFGGRKYVIPKGQNIKKALTKEQVKKIIEYKSENQAEMKAKDLWVFSYLCNGMNVADMVSLTYGNINSESLHFIRKKTSRSSGKQTQVPLLPLAKEIITKWGNERKSDRTLLFDFTTENASPEQIIRDRAQAIKTINKYIDRVCKSVGIKDIKVTTYYARHSYATVLKNSGVSQDFICESLGHSDLKTTQSYLDSFEESTKMDKQKNLLS